jgi:hypothetical protein
MIARRKFSLGRLPKVAEQPLAAEQAISSVAIASAPPPMGGTSLIVYTNTEARHSAQ